MTGEGGGATILVIALCAFVATVGVGTASLGVLFDAREQAATAAEAAALAAAVATYPPTMAGSPQKLAAEYASLNGARLVSCWCVVDSTLRARVVAITVALSADVPLFGEVLVGKTARAEFDPRSWLGR
jgi:hypothetical protein